LTFSRKSARMNFSTACRPLASDSVGVLLVLVVAMVLMVRRCVLSCTGSCRIVSYSFPVGRGAWSYL